MKKLVIIFLVGIFFFSSCEKNDDDYSLGYYYISLGTISVDSADFTILLDNGLILIPSIGNANYFSVENNERVLVDYTILDDVISDEQTSYHVRINALYHVLSKEPILITEENRDSLGNDLIDIVELWIGSDYLNIDFRYVGGNKIHFINLGIDSISVSQDTAYLEFMHNAQDDFAEAYLGGLVSFDLDTFKYVGQDSIVLIIDATGLDQEIQNLSVTYSY